MSRQVFEALELVAVDLVPSVDVLSAGSSQPPEPQHHSYSDLFPTEHYRYFQGPLGDYSAGGETPESHPLYAAVQGLYAAYYEFGNQEIENDFIRTEVTGRGKMSTMLQNHIGQCIAKGYDNIAEQLSPDDAVRTVSGYIEERSATCASEYGDELDRHVTLLAELDRRDEEPIPTEIDGIPVISGRNIALAMGWVPESPEVERAHRKEYAALQISIARRRLIRLQFEQISAVALTQLLQEHVG